ncbi:hypothetical protein BU17DRAFT_95621 [Hysterangium stoloniferum]|nr:hypothetical protein BU17DRAFT_95621 [Hysterangium stoloniferum]
MLSSRPHNIAFPTNTDSTRNNTFKSTAKSLKYGRSLRNENAAHPQAISVTGRKQTVMFSTPAAGVSLKQVAQTEKGLRGIRTTSALAEITNRTPFIKQNLPITPGQASSKTTKPFKIFDDSAAASVRRISSTRKKLRLPRSASKSFETPETAGNHWDVSDVSIEASIMEEISVAEADYGDVEYLPPTAIESVFDPGFDTPDYKEVGATLLYLFRTMSIQDDSKPSEETTRIDTLKEAGSLVWETFELPDIPEDETFIPTKFNPEQPNAPISLEVTSLPSPQHKYSRENPLKPIATTFHKSNQPLSSYRASTRTTPVGMVAKGPMHSRIPSLSKKFTISENGITKPPNTKATRIGSMVPVDAARRYHAMPIASVRAGSIPSRSKSLTRIEPSPKLINRVKPLQKPFVLPDDTVLDLFVSKTDKETGNDFLFAL